MFQAEQETDEVYAQITLVPESNVRTLLPLLIFRTFMVDQRFFSPIV